MDTNKGRRNEKCVLKLIKRTFPYWIRIPPNRDKDTNDNIHSPYIHCPVSSNKDISPNKKAIVYSYNKDTNIQRRLEENGPHGPR